MSHICVIIAFVISLYQICSAKVMLLIQWWGRSPSSSQLILVAAFVPSMTATAMAGNHSALCGAFGAGQQYLKQVGSSVIFTNPHSRHHNSSNDTKKKQEKTRARIRTTNANNRTNHSSFSFILFFACRNFPQPLMPSFITNGASRPFWVLTVQMVTSPSSLRGALGCLRSTSPGGHEVMRLDCTWIPHLHDALVL